MTCGGFWLFVLAENWLWSETHRKSANEKKLCSLVIDSDRLNMFLIEVIVYLNDELFMGTTHRYMGKHRQEKRRHLHGIRPVLCGYVRVLKIGVKFLTAVDRKSSCKCSASKQKWRSSSGEDAGAKIASHFFSSIDCSKTSCDNVQEYVAYCM